MSPAIVPGWTMKTPIIKHDVRQAKEEEDRHDDRDRFLDAAQVQDDETARQDQLHPQFPMLILLGGGKTLKTWSTLEAMDVVTVRT